MTQQEALRVLVLLSQMEGYMLDKLGTHLPEPIVTELAEVCELLDKNIRKTAND